MRPGAETYESFWVASALAPELDEKLTLRSPYDGDSSIPTSQLFQPCGREFAAVAVTDDEDPPGFQAAALLALSPKKHAMCRATRE
jgi:hypothetical protein